MDPILYDIYPNIQTALQYQALWQCVQVGHSCHDHGRMVPYGRSWMPTCTLATTCPMNSHTFGNQPKALDPKTMRTLAN